MASESRADGDEGGESSLEDSCLAKEGVQGISTSIDGEFCIGGIVPGGGGGTAGVDGPAA